MRTKISEKIVFPDFDLFSEYQKIEHLLSEAYVIGHDHMHGRAQPQFTIEQYINGCCFLNWNLRGTFMSIKEMLDSLRACL